MIPEFFSFEDQRKNVGYITLATISKKMQYGLKLQKDYKHYSIFLYILEPCLAFHPYQLTNVLEIKKKKTRKAERPCEFSVEMLGIVLSCRYLYSKTT